MTFTADFFEFISKNIDAEPNRLRLKYYNATEYSFDMGLAIAQIECRQRIRRKLPSIAAEPRFLFPSTLLAEQCTDELVAQFHGSLFNGCRTVLDMTAGLCIDDIAIASNGCKVTGIEIDTNAAEIARRDAEKQAEAHRAARVSAETAMQDAELARKAAERAAAEGAKREKILQDNLARTEKKLEKAKKKLDSARTTFRFMGGRK